MIHDAKDYSFLQVYSQETSMSTKYDFEDRGSLHTSIHAMELKFDTKVKNHISWWSRNH